MSQSEADNNSGHFRRDPELPVKEGGLCISDHEDLKIAFLDLQKMCNHMQEQITALQNSTRDVIRENTRYGL